MVIAVTGANGQVGQSLRYIAQEYPAIEFHFFDSTQLNITEKESVEAILAGLKPDVCINTAAYTAVDKAEQEPEKARLINVQGAENLAEVCLAHHIALVHLSTDFVFDGTANTPYKESDKPNPTGVYGQTKWEGEQAIMRILPQHFIVRTAWVYSQFGHNFMKTMLRLANERTDISVVNDQIGSPTHAVDLARALVVIATQHQQGNYGIYHYSGSGQCSWYDFARAIFDAHHTAVKLHAIPSSQFPTPAKRPAYSVLDKSKFSSTFGQTVPTWESSLQQTI